MNAEPPGDPTGTSQVDGPPETVALVDACIPGLRRYAAVLARDRQDQDDLVHDCLVRALDRWHTRRENTSLRSWLFAIMHNLFVSRQRRRNIEVTPIDSVPEEKYRISADQERYLEFRDVVQALDRRVRAATAVLEDHVVGVRERLVASREPEARSPVTDPAP